MNLKDYYLTFSQIILRSWDITERTSGLILLNSSKHDQDPH